MWRGGDRLFQRPRCRAAFVAWRAYASGGWLHGRTCVVRRRERRLPGEIRGLCSLRIGLCAYVGNHRGWRAHLAVGCLLRLRCFRVADHALDAGQSRGELGSVEGSVLDAGGRNICLPSRCQGVVSWRWSSGAADCQSCRGGGSECHSLVEVAAASGASLLHREKGVRQVRHWSGPVPPAYPTTVRCRSAPNGLVRNARVVG